MTESKPFGKLYFRPEGQFVNAYMEEIGDQPPVHLCSIRIGLYQIDTVRGGFIAFAKYVVQMTFRDMGLEIPEMGEMTGVVNPVSGIKQ